MYLLSKTKVVGSSRETPRQNALRMSTKFNIRSAFFFRSSININQLHKHNIAVAPSLKAKREKQTKKGGEKSRFIRKLIYFSGVKLSHHISVSSNGENDVRSLQVASARQDEFVLLDFLHATGLA